MLIWRAFASTQKIRAMCRDKDDPYSKFSYSLSRGFDAAFMGFLIAGQFVTVGYYPFMWIHLALVVSLKNTVAIRQKKR
jgi:putative inorganic carbon (HCO3(-)) transporter